MSFVSERRYRIVVCRGPECGDKRNSRAVHEAFVRAVTSAQVAHRCELEWQSCFGRCSQGPNALVRELAATPAAAPRFAFADLPAARGGGARMATALYNRLAPEHAAEIVASHVVRGVVVSRLIERIPALSSLPVVVATAPAAARDDAEEAPDTVREVTPDVPTP